MLTDKPSILTTLLLAFLSVSSQGLEVKPNQLLLLSNASESPVSQQTLVDLSFGLCQAGRTFDRARLPLVGQAFERQLGNCDTESQLAKASVSRGRVIPRRGSGRRSIS